MRSALIPVLAWIGLGADGLSSSSYGPEEAFRTLGEHTYLAVGLALVTSITIVLISSAYSRIIEEFPHGGGGYVVASKMLGPIAGVVSGSALLVDYVLTIAVSIASACDALFSFLPPTLAAHKISVEVGLIIGLSILNIRGVRESVLAMTPMFILFIITHLIVIVGGIFAHLPELPSTVSSVATGFQSGIQSMGGMGMFLLFLHAYSMGGGTYTGLEAVSNGLPIMREPRVKTAKRTMFYMATSLSFTAGGIILCYLLWRVSFEPGKTMNAILTANVGNALHLGWWFVVLTLISEGALLIVAAQAGFLDGPRVLANMALDSWMPRQFAALSERLTTQNGIVLMGAASLVALLHAHGDVRRLVVMYSINVFLTFSLSMLGMTRHFWKVRKTNLQWRSRLSLFSVSLALCLTVLIITVIEKFAEGGWLTVAVTSTLVVGCFLVRRHYRGIGKRLTQLSEELENIPLDQNKPAVELDPTKPTAVILVGGYGGLGIHTMLKIIQTFPSHFHNLVFISVGVIDTGGFKGIEAVEELRTRTYEQLEKYLTLARGLGMAATYRLAVGTDVVEEAEKLCLDLARTFPKVTYFAGKLVFRQETWVQRLLHNEMAFSLQRRLHFNGHTLVILPTRI